MYQSILCTYMVISQWLFTNGTHIWVWLDDLEGEMDRMTLHSLLYFNFSVAADGE